MMAPCGGCRPHAPAPCLEARRCLCLTLRSPCPWSCSTRAVQAKASLARMEGLTLSCGIRRAAPLPPASGAAMTGATADMSEVYSAGGSSYATTPSPSWPSTNSSSACTTPSTDDCSWCVRFDRIATLRCSHLLSHTESPSPPLAMYARADRFSLCASAFKSSARPVPKISKTRTIWPLPAWSHLCKLPRSSSIRERAPNALIPNALIPDAHPQVCSALVPRAASADVQRLITSRGRSCL